MLLLLLTVKGLTVRMMMLMRLYIGRLVIVLWSVYE